MNAFAGSWQTAQLTDPLDESLLSKKSISPSATFSAVIGLSAGIPLRHRFSGMPFGTRKRNSVLRESFDKPKTVAPQINSKSPPAKTPGRKVSSKLVFASLRLCGRTALVDLLNLILAVASRAFLIGPVRC